MTFKPPYGINMAIREVSNMAESVEKLAAKMLLNNGTDAQGNVKTVSVSLPSLLPTATNEQILAIADKAEDILTKTVVKLQKVVTSNLKN